MLEEQGDPDQDWAPVVFYDPQDYDFRQANYPDPPGFYFPEER